MLTPLSIGKPPVGNRNNAADALIAYFNSKGGNPPSPPATPSRSVAAKTANDNPQSACQP